MFDELSILAAAKGYARQYGPEAADYARRCAAAMLIAADVDAWLGWTQVVRAIEQLQGQAEAEVARRIISAVATL